MRFFIAENIRYNGAHTTILLGLKTLLSLGKAAFTNNIDQRLAAVDDHSSGDYVSGQHLDWPWPVRITRIISSPTRNWLIPPTPHGESLVPIIFPNRLLAAGIQCFHLRPLHLYGCSRQLAPDSSPGIGPR